MPSTECVIIGAEHQETESYQVSDLLHAINRVKPHVVLVELDSSFFDNDGRLLHFCPDSLEDQAIKGYLAERPGVVLRPYDIEGRNQFYAEHRALKLEQALFTELGQMAEAQQLAGESLQLWSEIKSFLRKRDRFRNDGIKAVTGFECDFVVAQKRWFVDMAIARILEQTEGLKNYQEFWNLYKSFERKREYQMSRNILKYCTEFNGRRLLALCGLEHRSALRLNFPFDELHSQVKLREYWHY